MSDTLLTKLRKIKNEKQLHLLPEYIMKDITILGVTGTYTGDINNQNKTITNNGVYTFDEGYTGLGTVTVNTSNDTTATASANDILYPKTAWVNGEKLIGAIQSIYKDSTPIEIFELSPDKYITYYDLETGYMGRKDKTTDDVIISRLIDGEIVDLCTLDRSTDFPLIVQERAYIHLLKVFEDKIRVFISVPCPYPYKSETKYIYIIDYDLNNWTKINTTQIKDVGGWIFPIKNSENRFLTLWTSSTPRLIGTIIEFDDVSFSLSVITQKIISTNSNSYECIITGYNYTNNLLGGVGCESNRNTYIPFIIKCTSDDIEIVYGGVHVDNTSDHKRVVFLNNGLILDCVTGDVYDFNVEDNTVSFLYNSNILPQWNLRYLDYRRRFPFSVGNYLCYFLANNNTMYFAEITRDGVKNTSNRTVSTINDRIYCGGIYGYWDADGSLLGSNIGKNLAGLQRNHMTFMNTEDATATAYDIIEGKTAYVDGKKIIGTYTGDINNQNKTITNNGVYTFDEGYTGLGTVTIELPVYRPEYINFQYYHGTSLENALKNIDTSDITNMGTMFMGCDNVTSIDISHWNTSNVTKMSNMFTNCTSLQSVNLNGINTSNVEDIQNMFRYCTNLTSIDLSSLNLSNITNMYCTFFECTSLTSIDLSGVSIDGLLNMGTTFYGCTSLQFLDISSITFNNWINGDSSTFEGIPTDCLIYVKDQAARDWVLARRSDFTNVQIKEVS